MGLMINISFILSLIYIFNGYKIFIFAALPILIGVLLNRIVMHLNNGRMPVRIINRHWYEIVENSDIHCIMNKNSRFRWAGDVFYTKHSIMSIGDIMAFIGLIIFICLSLLPLITDDVIY